jgi:hypothetical protein
VIARIELRLSDEEWLDLSYRQFTLLRDRYLTSRWQDQYQQGAIWQAINLNGFREYKDPAKAPKPDDLVFVILPGQKPSKERIRRRISNKAQMAAMRAMLRNAARRVITSDSGASECQAT